MAPGRRYGVRRSPLSEYMSFHLSLKLTTNCVPLSRIKWEREREREREREIFIKMCVLFVHRSLFIIFDYVLGWVYEKYTTHIYIYIYIYIYKIIALVVRKIKHLASDLKMKIYNESLSRGKNIYWKKKRKGQPCHTNWKKSKDTQLVGQK